MKNERNKCEKSSNVIFKLRLVLNLNYFFSIEEEIVEEIFLFWKNFVDDAGLKMAQFSQIIHLATNKKKCSDNKALTMFRTNFAINF